MIRTPSLRNRMTVLTLAVVAVIVVALDVFVYLSLAERLDDVLDQVLQARTQATTQVAQTTDSPRELVDALSAAGVPAVVHLPDGRQLRTEPGQRLFDQLPPSPAAASAMQDVERVVVDDVEVEVLVSRGGTNATLRRVLVLEAIGSTVAIALAVLLLNRAARLVTRPVDRIVDIADQIADGRTDLRVDPSDPTTEVGRIAAALDRVVAALDQALSSARREEERSRAFLADAAHQLRTPVAGLRASTETLLTTDSEPDREELLNAVAREADRIGRLVNALLTMARLDRPEPIQRRDVELVELLESEIEHQAGLAPGLTFDLAAPDGVVVRGDDTWIRAAIGNVLDNARRHARGRVDVDLTDDAATWRIAIRDDGAGVAVEDRDRIFGRFVSLDGRGSGLGLPIARAIAVAHEGSLELVEDRFELRLPMEGASRRRQIRHG